MGDKGEPIMHSPLLPGPAACPNAVLSDVYFRTSSRMNFVPWTSLIFDRSI